MKTNRHKQNLMRLLWSLPGVGILALVYLISQNWFTRVDLTRDHLYSLNQGTIDLLEGLEGTVHIKLYFSRHMPARFQPVADFVRTLVDEYEARGKGRVKVTSIDPGSDPVLIEEANQQGIVETRANISEKNRIEAINLWFGIAVLYDGASEVFPAVQSIENFEYDISSAIVRLRRKNKPRILLVGPTFEEGKGTVWDIGRDIKPVYAELSQHYAVNQVRLKTETALDLASADTVLAWGLPYFSEAQLYALDQYIVSGKPVLLLVSGLRVDPNILLAQALPRSRADEFYAHLGFAVNRNLVSDTRCTKIKYTNVRPPVFESYSLFPLLAHVGGGLDEKHSSTANLKALVIPWASSLKTLQTEGITARIIGSSSDQAWIQESGYIIDPKHLPGPTQFDRYPLGLALEGRFNSFFSQGPTGSTDFKQTAERANTVLVWGSEHLLTQAHQTSILEWVNHAAGFLCHRGELAGVDRRESAFAPTRELSDKEKTATQWLSVGVAPILVLLLAFMRRLLRQRRDLTPYLGQRES